MIAEIFRRRVVVVVVVETELKTRPRKYRCKFTKMSVAIGFRPYPDALNRAHFEVDIFGLSGYGPDPNNLLLGLQIYPSFCASKKR